MTYKLSRKEVIKETSKIYDDEIMAVFKDLLAQKEDTKEYMDIKKKDIRGNYKVKIDLRVLKGCKHFPIFEQSKNGLLMKCKDCGKSIKSTPSPLEGFEEIDELVNSNKEFKSFEIICQTVNQLISNQKKLYQYIKEKKI